MKVEVTQSKKAYNEFTVKFKGTAGQMLVVENALEFYAKHSPSELPGEVHQAVQAAFADTVQKFR